MYGHIEAEVHAPPVLQSDLVFASRLVSLLLQHESARDDQQRFLERVVIPFRVLEYVDCHLDLEGRLARRQAKWGWEQLDKLLEQIGVDDTVSAGVDLLPALLELGMVVGE